MVSSTGLNHLISFYKKVQVHFGQNKSTGDENTLSKLSEIFILPFIRNIGDFEFLRLQFSETINYYEKYYSIYTTKRLSEKIEIMYRYIKKGPIIFEVHP